ncbi:MAG: hypothetical protein WCY11_02515 [Novosphingobium sp.]
MRDDIAFAIRLSGCIFAARHQRCRIGDLAIGMRTPAAVRFHLQPPPRRALFQQLRRHRLRFGAAIGRNGQHGRTKFGTAYHQLAVRADHRHGVAARRDLRDHIAHTPLARNIQRDRIRQRRIQRGKIGAVDLVDRGASRRAAIYFRSW